MIEAIPQSTSVLRVEEGKRAKLRTLDSLVLYTYFNNQYSTHPRNPKHSKDYIYRRK